MVAPERRGSSRVSFSGVTVVLAGQTEIRCMADNVSESGMLIFPIALSPPRPGPFFRVTFTFPFTTDWVELGATLARSTLVNRRPAWGVKFTEVPGNARALIQRLVAERGSPSTAGGPGEETAATPAEPRPPADPTREEAVEHNVWLDEADEDTAPLAAEDIALLRELSLKEPAD